MSALAHGGLHARARGQTTACGQTSVHAKRREGKGPRGKGPEGKYFFGAPSHHDVAYVTRESSTGMMTATRLGIAS